MYRTDLWTQVPHTRGGGRERDEWIKKLWYIYTMEYYSVIKRNEFESVLVRWMNLDPVIQSELSQKERNKYCILIHVYMESRKMVLMNLFVGQQ